MNANDHRRQFDLLWTHRETCTILAMCAIAAVALTAAAAAGKFEWIQSLPAPDEQAQARIREKIDPNTAGVASLRRLHGIGPVYAQAIVDYRTQTGKVFRHPSDLEAVRGLGPTRVSQIAAELSFPGEKGTGNQEPGTGKMEEH